MADVFEDHPTIDAARQQLWNLVRQTPEVNWQILTKRPERIAAGLPRDWGNGYANVWLGTSIESEEFLGRANELAHVPAAVRFLSIEPLLSPISALPLNQVHWVILGGESGPRARPMDIAWVRTIRDLCLEREVPFFFKQWGGVNKKASGRILDGKTWSQYPRER